MILTATLCNNFGFVVDKSLFLRDWLNVFKLRIDLIDDTPSKEQNFSDFIENRYDQSVFSIMCKKNQIENLSAYECDWAYLKDLRTWLHLKDKPIISKRDLKYSIFRRFVNRQKRTLRRLLNKLKIK